MHHTLAFFNTTAGALSLSDCSAVTDGWATVTNNHFIMQQDMNLLMVAPFAGVMTRCQLNLPHWRFVNQPEIVPVIQTWDGIEAREPYYLAPKNLTINNIDELQALISTSATATGGALVALWMEPLTNNLNLPAGQVYPCRFTSSISGATGAWARGNIVFDQTLPAGEYAVVGLDVVDAASQLARLRFQTYTMLPGTWVRQRATGSNPRFFRNGRWGNWGQFMNTAQPTLEIFSATGTATSQTGVLDLVKVR